MLKTENILKKYFLTSEVCSICDIKKHTLRYWQKEIDQIKTVQVNKKKYFTKDQINIINLIKQKIYEEGYTLEGVKKLIYTNNVNKKNPTNIELLKIEINNLIKYIKSV